MKGRRVLKPSNEVINNLICRLVVLDQLSVSMFFDDALQVDVQFFIQKRTPKFTPKTKVNFGDECDLRLQTNSYSSLPKKRTRGSPHKIVRLQRLSRSAEKASTRLRSTVHGGAHGGEKGICEGNSFFMHQRGKQTYILHGESARIRHVLHR